MEFSSSSTFCLYAVTSFWWSPPFSFSFALIEPMMRSDARRAPTTFLYATERRLRSSRLRSLPAPVATSFMYSTISSYLSACPSQK